MKLKSLLLVALISLLYVTEINAQSHSQTSSRKWKGIDLQEWVDSHSNGDKSPIYLYNVGTGRFMVDGGDWGMEARLFYDDFGRKVSLKIENENGSKALKIEPDITENASGTKRQLTCNIPTVTRDEDWATTYDACSVTTILDGYTWFGKWNFQANGEVAQGHNSAIVAEKGRAFLVYHTRFNTGNEWFQDRVHQLFTSENGWLLSAPMEFNGESVTDADIKAGCEFSEQQMVGEYHMLIHKFGLNNEALAIATPSIVNLTADGKIEGAYTGSWKMKEGTAYINLKVGGMDYEGVVVGQTIDDTTLKTIGITAASRNGFMLWAYKVLPQYAVAYNAKNMTYPVSNNSTVNSHIDLTTSSVYGVKNEWYSSVPSVISNTGKYNPADTVTHIVLTNRIFAENYAYEKQFNIRAAKADSLPGDYLGGIVAYYPFDEKPIVNAYDETQRGTASKLTNGTIPDLKEDGARIGQVIQFHEGTHAKSSGSYLRMPNPLLEKTDLEGITVSAWMKRGNAQDLFGTAWAFTTSTPIIATNQERLFLTLNSYIGYTNKVDTFAINYPKASNSTIPEGEWRLVTVVIDKSGIETYVNGIKRTKIFTSTAGSNITNFDMQKVLDTIARSKYFTLGIGNGIGTAEACYDDLLIYNRALTHEDVKLLYSMERRVTDFTEGLDTSIDELMMDHPTLSRQSLNEWFDLTGRKILEPTAPGIYIFNGKKVRK